MSLSLFKKISHWVWKRRHFGFKKPTLREIALKHCELHPSARASISLAGRKLEAKEAEHENPERAHRFTSSAPWGRCIQCEITREFSVSPVCDKWQPDPDIEGIIRSEEALFNKMVVRGKKIVLALNRKDLTGAKLAYLHQTHGISPDVVEMILGITLAESIHLAYAEAYKAHQATGAKGHKKTILVAR